MKGTDYFLGEGKYTKRDKLMKKELKKILQIKERQSLWGKISYYLEHNFEFVSCDDKKCRTRTASEIINSKKILRL